MITTTTTPYQFVVRATTPLGIFDRQFSIDVTNISVPVWSTSTGYTSYSDYNTSTAYLKIGPEEEKYGIIRQWVDYQFSATSEAGTVSFYIPEKGGRLPPGLTLDPSGKLSGFINDTLIFDGVQGDNGGYDEESYDFSSYDYGTVLYDPIGVPKIYQFKVNATNGVSEASRYFKILVVSPAMIRNPERIQMTLETNLVTTITNYIPPIQFIHGADLGVIRASNNATIDVSGYDPEPEFGVTTYNVVPGTDELSNLPEFLSLDSETGLLYGYIPYQPAYSKNYDLTISAVKTYASYISTSTATFSLVVKGEVESTIQWLSSSTLSAITVGEVSESAVVAKQVGSDYKIKYQLVNGNLPNGITLMSDGSLSGTPDYNSTGTYNFTVLAQDVYELSGIEKDFTLTVVPYNNKRYTKIYAKPFLPLNQRKLYSAFVTNAEIFPPELLYRYQDTNFGIQTDFRVIFEFGIEETTLDKYVTALRENFYRKSFYFGDYKIARAQDNTGKPLYEVIYVDIIDSLENSSQSVSSVIHSNNKTYYPSSITNMRERFEKIALNSTTLIGINEFNLPKFMRTPQPGEYKTTGYIHVLPLCYALPGEGEKILARIKLNGFNFNQFNFEIDRLIIESAQDANSAKYLIFDREHISDQTADDRLLYGADGVILTSTSNDPITKY